MYDDDDEVFGLGLKGEVKKIYFDVIDVSLVTPKTPVLDVIVINTNYNTNNNTK